MQMLTTRMRRSLGRCARVRRLATMPCRYHSSLARLFRIPRRSLWCTRFLADMWQNGPEGTALRPREGSQPLAGGRAKRHPRIVDRRFHFDPSGVAAAFHEAWRPSQCANGDYISRHVSLDAEPCGHPSGMQCRSGPYVSQSFRQSFGSSQPISAITAFQSTAGIEVPCGGGISSTSS